MPKAKKVYKGIAFCGACYAREFHRVPCIKCKKRCRQHFSAYGGLCPDCSKEERRCLRCERPVLKAALIVGDRPVCPSCRRHFRPKVSYRPIGHATCRVCRKYRFAVSQDEKGRPICSRCTKADRTDEIRVQEAAYWCGALRKKARLASIEIGQDWVIRLWDHFIETETSAGNAKATALKIALYIQFFSRLDASFSSTDLINGEALCEAFTGDELRRYFKPLSFLAACSIQIPTQEQKVRAIEESRIKRMVETAEHCAHYSLLREFAAELLRIHPDSPPPNPKTARMSIRPAADLTQVAGSEPLQQRHVDHYLRTHRGQVAALHKYIGFLKRRGLDVRLPPRRQVSRRRPEASAIPVDMLQAAAQSGHIGKSGAAVIALFLHCFGMTQAMLLNLPRTAAAERHGKLCLDFDQQTIELDSRLAQAMSAFLRMRDAKHGVGGLLFPGRHATHSMSASGIAYHLSRWGFSAGPTARNARRALKNHADAVP